MKKTAGKQIRQLASGVMALMLLAHPLLAAAWQKGAPESDRKAALKALPQLIRDAENRPARQLDIGFLYAQGIEGRPDYARALEWYRKAADAGSSTAMYLLAVMSIEGLGTEQDDAAALRWARKIADSGDDSGYMLLGMLHESGAGVPKDEAKAAQYYGYAAREARDIGARYRLGMLNLEGKGMPKNMPHAMQWLESAAALGDRHARYQLGHMYFTGTGVEVDYVRAGTWFEKTLATEGAAAHRRFPDIFGAAGVAGEDYTRRMQRMMKKDPHVMRNARFMLGRIYEKFGDTPLNRDCAKAYYGMAARAGHRDARQRLAAMKKTEREKLKAAKRQDEAAAKEAAGKAAETRETASLADAVVAVPVLKATPEKTLPPPVAKAEEIQAVPPARPPALRQPPAVPEAKNMTAPRAVAAQETDGIAEIVGVLDNPVAQVAMELVSSILAQDAAAGAKNNGAGIENASGM